MMATSLKHEAFHKNLECPVCLSFFQEPKILTCSHTFCKGCLDTLLESRGKLLCPTCREETLVPGGDVGRLQSNITVRSLVEDVETQGQVCTNFNQENESFQRKWNKCRKHPSYDEECFCLNCNKYVCSMCGLLEHAKDAHTILEAGEHETEQRNHVEKLASEADAKICSVCSTIQVFKPEGGKAIRRITLNGPAGAWQPFKMTSSPAIVIKITPSFYLNSSQVQVINDVSGAIIHCISKGGDDPYPAVCQDDSVIIAWVKRDQHDQRLVSIVKYTEELKYLKNILTDFKITKSYGGFLQAFKTGEIAFCTQNRLYIFHETWE